MGQVGKPFPGTTESHESEISRDDGNRTRGSKTLCVQDPSSRFNKDMLIQLSKSGHLERSRPENLTTARRIAPQSLRIHHCPRPVPHATRNASQALHYRLCWRTEIWLIPLVMPSLDRWGWTRRVAPQARLPISLTVHYYRRSMQWSHHRQTSYRASKACNCPKSSRESQASR